MDIRSVFGRNMRRYRLAAGLSQAAVAVRMGVDRAHVSSMERGLQNATLLTVWQASEALGVRPAALLAEPEGETTMPKPSRRSASPGKR